MSLQDPSASSRNQEHSRKNRAAIQLFVAIFHVCYAVRCCCVPASHRKFFTLWHPRYNNSCSRLSRPSFCDTKRTVLLFVRVRALCGRAIVKHNEGQVQPALPLNFKSIRAVQQRCNSSCSGTTPVKLAALVHIHRNARVPPFQLATPPGLQAPPEGDVPGTDWYTYQIEYEYECD